MNNHHLSKFYLLPLLAITFTACKKEMPIETDLIAGHYVMYFDGYTFKYKDSVYSQQGRAESGSSIFVERYGDSFMMFALPWEEIKIKDSYYAVVRKKHIRYFNYPYRNIRIIYFPLALPPAPPFTEYKFSNFDSVLLDFNANVETNFQYNQSFTGKAYQQLSTMVKYRYSNNAVVNEYADVYVTYTVRMEKYRLTDDPYTKYIIME